MRHNYSIGRGRACQPVAGHWVAQTRRFRAKEYQYEKVESFEEMCLRLESGY